MTASGVPVFSMSFVRIPGSEWHLSSGFGVGMIPKEQEALSPDGGIL
jgi:hypothetical protein